MIDYFSLAGSVVSTIWQNKGAAALLVGVKLYDYVAAHPFVSAYVAYRGARSIYRRIFK